MNRRMRTRMSGGVRGGGLSPPPTRFLLFACSDGRIHSMNLQRILNSQHSGVWALQISRRLPLGMGLRISKLVADWIATKKDLPLVQAIRLNRWVVSGCEWGADELDAAVRANLRHIAGSYFILFHYLDQPELLQKQVVFSQALDDLIAQTRELEAKSSRLRRSHEQFRPGSSVSGLARPACPGNIASRDFRIQPGCAVAAPVSPGFWP